jgi:hypothetical protein
MRHRYLKMLVIGAVTALSVLSPTGPADGGIAFAKYDAVATQTAFPDVKGHWAASDIGHMVSAGVIKGFPDGTFRPDEAVTQEQFMALVQRSLPPFPGHEWDSFTHEMYLKDVQGRWSEQAYSNLLAAGVMVYGGKPTAGLKRLQAARVLLAALASQSEGEKYRGTRAKFFSDIEPTDEYQVLTVYPIYKLGMMGGYPDGSFRPEEKVTRAQAVVLVKRLQQKINELYPDNVTAETKRAMVDAVKTFVEDVIDTQQIRRFNDLQTYVKEKNLPVSDKFLEEHFSFMKYDATDYIAFPQWNELIYFTKIDDGKYRMTVQYYSGELGGSVDKTFYLSSRDGKTFRLIGKNE